MASLGWDVFWRDRGALSGLKNLGNEADRTHSKFGRMARGLDRGLGAGLSNVTKGLGLAGGAALKFGGLAVAGLGAAGVAAVGFGVKVASGNEQARISFTTMLGSAKRADVFLRQLQKFAATTPFEFPELQTAASSLISAGINANKVIPIMTTLGNVTSGMGTGAEGVRRATIALQQMNAAGRITGEDLNQLRDAGIPVYDLLAAATGKSKAEVVKLAQAGKLGSKELGLMMKALESGKGLERFAGLMDKQSKSLAGLWSTLKDTLGQGLAGVVQQFFPMMKSGLDGISEGAAKVFGWFNRNKESISSVFSTSATILRSFGRVAKAVLGSFIGSMSEGGLTVKNFAEYLETHQEDIVGAFVSITKGAIRFGIGLAKVLSAGLKGFGALADGIGLFTAHQVDNLATFLHAATIAFAWVPGMGPKLLAADIKFSMFAAHARGNIHKTGDAARGFASGLDNRLIPTLQKAGRTVDDVGRKEIVKARARDGVNKAAQAVRKYSKDLRDVPHSITTKINWDTAVDGINTKLTLKYGKAARLISANADGGVLPGWTPGRDVHQFYSPTGGQLNLSGGEAVMRPEWTRAVGGPSAVHRMNAAARGGSFALGGVYGAGTDAVVAGGRGAIAALMRGAVAAQDAGRFGGVGVAGAGHLARAALARVGDAWDIGTCLRFVRMMAGAPGGTYDASAAWANARYKHRGDRQVPSGVPVYWGGGHGHIAVSIGGGRIVGTDYPRTGRIGIGTIGGITSAWGKRYLGWANDVNGVVTSSYGLPAARHGGVFGAGPVHVGEAGPERILTAAQTRTFDRMVRVMSQNGGAVTYVVNISAPNYIGSRQELRQTLVDMTRSGAFEVVKR